MKNKTTNILIVLTIMALTSCIREELLSSSGNGEEGERVKVALSFPPAEAFPLNSSKRHLRPKHVRER